MDHTAYSANELAFCKSKLHTDVHPKAPDVVAFVARVNDARVRPIFADPSFSPEGTTMKVTYRTGGGTFQIEPALLVVACDPRALQGIMDYTNQERAIFAALQNFTFFTTCVKVRPARKQDRVVILDAEICSLMDGIVHGYRNETAKQWGLDAANQQSTNLVTISRSSGPA
jgi:hypothetical protein